MLEPLGKLIKKQSIFEIVSTRTKLNTTPFWLFIGVDNGDTFNLSNLGES
jgi:hypothetical protein